MLFELWFSSNTCIQLKQCTIVLKMGKEYNLVERQIDWQELRSKTRWSIGKHPLIIISKSPRSEDFLFYNLLKRLAYTLTAYCYGSKSVMQLDASSKRYLWDKISCYRTQNNSDRYQFYQNIASGSNCLARFSQFKVNKKQKP